MMPSWSRFSEIAHRASIAGKVVDGVTGRPLQGVVVRIERSAAPPLFQTWIDARMGSASLDDRPDRTQTAGDGQFRFVDLPLGDYTLSFTVPRGEGRYGKVERSFNVPGDLLGKDPTVVRLARDTV